MSHTWCVASRQETQLRDRETMPVRTTSQAKGFTRQQSCDHRAQKSHQQL